MSPQPIPSLSGFNPIMSRRVLFGGATAVAAAGVLSACGSSSPKTEHKANETPLYEINEQDPSKLKQGGALNLSTYSIGPDFNRFSQNGSSVSISETMGIIAGAGIWRSTFKGEDELDPNYCLGFEAKEVDGKITAEVRLNPKAVFNDGTPIDIDALKATWQIQRDPDGEYKIAAAGIYEYIESVEAIDGDRYHARVVLKTAHNPVKGSALRRNPAPGNARRNPLQRRLRGQPPPRTRLRPLHPGTQRLELLREDLHRRPQRQVVG